MEEIIQWYPGHIAKLERELAATLKPLDVVIEILDARIPVSSSHKALSEMVRRTKPVLLVLNKSDLADPSRTDQWLAAFKSTYAKTLAFDSSTGKHKAAVIEAVVKLGEPQMLKQVAKGLKRRPVRTGVIGMPNVGKSSLINALIGKKKMKTGHRAGVTRQIQWVRVHPQVELMDTPGLIPAKLESIEMGRMLASVYSVGDAAFDEEAVVPHFLESVDSLYPGLLQKALDLPVDQSLSLEAIARRRGLLLPAGELDLRRTAQAVLKDYRHGRLGRITLERPDTVYEPYEAPENLSLEMIEDGEND